MTSTVNISKEATAIYQCEKELLDRAALHQKAIEDKQTRVSELLNELDKVREAIEVERWSKLSCLKAAQALVNDHVNNSQVKQPRSFSVDGQQKAIQGLYRVDAKWMHSQ